MAQKNATFAAIDVGTTKVCAIVGRGSGPDDLQVLAHSTVPCDGLRKGNVADSKATTQAIRRVVMDVSREAGVTIDAAYVGVTGAHVSFENRWDALDWVGDLGVITSDDLKRVPEKISAAATVAGRRVMHAIPLTYALDGEKTIRNPLGMHARNLEVETHVVSGNQSYVRRLVEAVESAGIEVKDLVFEPLASSEAVLTAAEKQEGVALVDIGGGTTDIVVFQGGMVRYTGVVPVGGYQFTNDICQTYGASYKDAEQAKLAGDFAQLVNIFLHCVADIHQCRQRFAFGLFFCMAKNPLDLCQTAPAVDPHHQVTQTRSVAYPTRRADLAVATKIDKLHRKIADRSRGGKHFTLELTGHVPGWLSA